jgi:hypothetical protein
MQTIKTTKWQNYGEIVRDYADEEHDGMEKEA